MEEENEQIESAFAEQMISAQIAREEQDHPKAVDSAAPNDQPRLLTSDSVPDPSRVRTEELDGLEQLKATEEVHEDSIPASLEQT